MKFSDIDPSIEPGSDKWHDERLGLITSSENHVLFVNGSAKNFGFGAGAITYLNKKISEILTKEAKSAPDTEAILHGLSEEPFAGERHSMITNMKWTENFWIKYNDTFGGTNDGAYISNGIIKAVREIKCPDSQKHVRVLKCTSAEDLGDIDNQYWHQPQSNLLFCEADFCDFVSYDPRVLAYDLQIKIIRMFPSMNWRKSFDSVVNRAGEFMVYSLEQILKTPELNASFRMADFNADKLKEGISGLNEIVNSTLLK